MGLAKQITGNALYRIIYLVFQLFNTILISRLAGPSGFGLYSLVIVNANFFLMLTSLGIPSGLLYHASIKDVSLKSLLNVAWASTLIQLILIGIFEFFYHQSSGFFFIWNESSWMVGLAGIIFFIVIVINEKYYALYNGYGKLRIFNKLSALFNLILFLALAVLFFIPIEHMLRTVIFLYIGVQVVQLLTLVINFHLIVVSHTGSGSGKALMTYSLLAYCSNAVFFLLTRVDFWILEYYKGTEELGFYALAVRIVQMLLLLPTFLSSIILPSVAADNFNHNSMERILRLLNTLNILLITSILVCANWLLPLAFGTPFRNSILPLIILLPGILFLSAQTFLSSYFAGKGSLKVNLVSTSIALLIAVVLDFILIPAMGAVGAAIASSFSYLVCFIYSYHQYCNKTGYSYRSLLINDKDRLWLRQFLSGSWQQSKTGI